MSLDPSTSRVCASSSRWICFSSSQSLKQQPTFLHNLKLFPTQEIPLLGLFLCVGERNKPGSSATCRVNVNLEIPIYTGEPRLTWALLYWRVLVINRNYLEFLKCVNGIAIRHQSSPVHNESIRKYQRGFADSANSRISGSCCDSAVASEEEQLPNFDQCC